MWLISRRLLQLRKESFLRRGVFKYKMTSLGMLSVSGKNSWILNPDQLQNLFSWWFTCSNLSSLISTTQWSARRLMQHSKKLPRELQASNLEEISSFVGSFFLRADNAPHLRVWTVSRFLRVGKEVGTSSSSNPLGFRRGPCIMRSSRLPCSSRRILCLLFQSNN